MRFWPPKYGLPPEQSLRKTQTYILIHVNLPKIKPSNLTLFVDVLLGETPFSGWLAAGGDLVWFIYKMEVVVTDAVAPLPLTDLLRVPCPLESR